jgi:hypothetical protein
MRRLEEIAPRGPTAGAPRARAAAALAALAAVALAACSKEEGPPASGSAAQVVAAGGPPAREAVLAAWRAGGIEVSALTPAQVGFGADCQSGIASGVDVILCAYAAPAEAAAAEAAGLAWVGGTTGAAMSAGAVLIGIADRRRADPTGRTINQLMKLAPRPAPAGGAGSAGSARGAGSAGSAGSARK